MRLFRLLWVGVLLAVLAGTGIGGGVASAQTQQEFFYTQPFDVNKPFLRVTANERTSVHADGIIRTYVDDMGVAQDLYRVPYIEVNFLLQSRSSGDRNYQEGGRYVMPRGFTSSRTSYKGGTLNPEYTSWDCSGDIVLDTGGPSLSTINGPRPAEMRQARSSSTSTYFLPYALEITLTDDPTIAGVLPDKKVCIAPEALKENSFYNAADSIGNANQGRGASAAPVPAYDPETFDTQFNTLVNPDAGYVIVPGSEEIIFPADGAAITHTHIMYGQLSSDPSAASGYPTGYDYLDIENAPALGRIAGPFTYTVTYHADGSLSGNGLGALSFSCSGGYNPNDSGDENNPNVDGLRLDSSWCTRDYVPDADVSSNELLPSFDADVSGSAVAVTCAFQIDGLCRDVTTSSADYVGSTLLTGSTHDFVMKVYSEKQLSLLRLGIGASAPDVPIGTAEVVVEIRLAEDYTVAKGYRLSTVVYGNNGAQEIMRNNEGFRVTPFLNAVSVPANNVTLSSEPCAPNQLEQCLVATISDVTFLADLSHSVYSLTAINVQAQQTTRYLR